MGVQHSLRSSKLKQAVVPDVVCHASSLIADSSFAPSERCTLRDNERAMFRAGVSSTASNLCQRNGLFFTDAQRLIEILVSRASPDPKKLLEIPLRTHSCFNFFGFCSTLGFFFCDPDFPGFPIRRIFAGECDRHDVTVRNAQRIWAFRRKEFKI
jgi:hypothetical protein